MTASLDEHRLGGLRWIVLRGPDREAFQALGEHMREEMAALTQTWPLVTRLREHVSVPPGSERLASVRQASASRFPEAWAELADFAKGCAVPFDDLALMNFRGDLGPVTGGIGCSDLAWRRERSLIGHNPTLTTRPTVPATFARFPPAPSAGSPQHSQLSQTCTAQDRVTLPRSRDGTDTR